MSEQQNVGRIFNMRTYTDACDCTDAVRESALEVDSGRKIPCRTRDSNLRQYCARPLSWMRYQLSYLRPITWISLETGNWKTQLSAVSCCY